VAIIEFLIEKAKFLVPLIIILLVASRIFSKTRWQFYPIYIIVLIYFILVLLNYFNVLNISPFIGKWILGLSIFLIVISTLLFLVFPKASLPNPTGKYRVGTRVFELEDKTRDEIYTKDKNDKRRLKYQVFYPVDNTKGLDRAKWMVDGLELTRKLASSMHMLPFMLDHTVDIKANSYWGANLSKDLDKYHLVLISHGWKGFRELHTDFAEELASKGFIAVSIDHTYGSQAVKFEDGSVAFLNEDALANLGNPFNYNSDSNVLVRTYGEDVASVLNDLEALNKNDPNFKDKLNLDSIGLLGHSTGGGGDVYIGLKDKRVKAILGLDAWVSPLTQKELSIGLNMPSLFLRSEEWSKGPNNTALDIIINNSSKASLIQVNKTKHVDFTMAYMYSPLLKYVGFSGMEGGREGARLQREIILKFFEKHLSSDISIKDDYLNNIINLNDNLKAINLNLDN